MTHASLFSGIGGAELAASWMGWENVFHCEINPFGRKVLEYWFPNSKSYEDITKTDFREWRGGVDVLTGGFPCQPFSQAGKRKGNEDDRYLWPQMLRAIREIQPTWVVGENVAGITSMVESGSDIEMGRTDDIFEENYIYRKEQEFTIERICEDFESVGYSIQPIIIPACAVGAPHRRDRVWFIAHRDDAGAESEQGREELSNEFKTVTNTGLQRQKKSEEQSMGIEQFCESGLVADPYGFRRTKRGAECTGKEKASDDRTGVFVESKRFGQEQATTYTIYAGNTTQKNEVDTNEPEKMRRGEPQSEFARYGDNGIIADTESKQSKRSEFSEQSEVSLEEQRKFGRNNSKIFITDSNGGRQPEKEYRIEKTGLFTEKSKINDWSDFPTQPPICRRNDGLSDRLAGITFPKWRNESIKAMGNAWVPQVAYEIFKAIEKINKKNHENS